jgi:DNA-binding transcriptional LysR family regulator
MQRSQLSDMSIFVEVARANGFRAAARNLGLGPGSVSDAVQRFEDRLGVRLFDRTTRKIALTSLGHRLYQRSLPAIDDLAAAVRELKETSGDVTGTLKLSAPRSSGPFFLDKLFGQYAAAFPQVAVEMIYDDRKIDLVGSGVDAVIRSQNLLEQDTHAVSIGPALAMALVASPAYLKRQGHPKAPSDVIDHDGICFAFGGGQHLAPWEFDGDDGRYSVTPKPRMIVNDLVSLLTYAEAGLGLAYVYRAPAEPALASGRLVSLLDDRIPTLPRYTVNYLTKRHMPARLRAFIDMAKTLG